MLGRWLRTLWRWLGPHRAQQEPQCAAPAPPCGPEWAAGLTELDRDARRLAGAFRRWAQSQPQFAGKSLNVQYVLQLYATASHDGWPCARDFLRELSRVMPKRRIWRQGQALTVYAVLESEIVPLRKQHARKTA